jgi:hypothetical protein
MPTLSRFDTVYNCVEVINFLCVGANKNFNKMLLCDIAFKWKNEGAADYETLSLQCLKLNKKSLVNWKYNRSGRCNVRFCSK